MMPSKRQWAMLESVNNTTRHSNGVWQYMVTSRSNPASVAERCVKLGWLKSETVMVVDGDGYHVEPEQWRTGYALTDAGLKLLELTGRS